MLLLHHENVLPQVIISGLKNLELNDIDELIFFSSYCLHYMFYHFEH